jgi:Fe2+-dicitrate sensor, membrane component
MKDIKNLLSKYLTEGENPSERKEIYDWYHAQDNKGLHNDAEIDKLSRHAKDRVFESIRLNKRRALVRQLVRIGAVAASLIFVGLMGYYYWDQQHRVVLADDHQLAAIAPAGRGALITLPDGSKIATDDLQMNVPMEMGDFIITKDQAGEVSYHPKNGVQPKNQSHCMETARSSTYDLVLSDGTKVKLNENSSLTYPAAFGEGDRIVTLEGEAYFQVTKSEKHSRFKVKTQHQTTEVLGTKFNIRSYHGEPVVYTTLAEGRIQVEPQNEKLEGVLLHPGQQSVLTEKHIATAIVDLDVVLGWTQDIFYFNGTNTEAVLDQIAKWYNIDITYDKGATEIRYRGKIPRNLPLDQLVKLLEYADLKVKPTIDKNKRVNLIINSSN